MKCNVAMTWGYQRYAFPDKCGNDVDVKFIDLSGVKERGDQLSHHPSSNMLSRSCAQTPRKGFDWFRHELNALRGLLWSFTRKHQIGDLPVKHSAFDAVLPGIFQCPVIRLASEKNGVDGAVVERAHTVIDVTGPAV